MKKFTTFFALALAFLLIGCSPAPDATKVMPIPEETESTPPSTFAMTPPSMTPDEQTSFSDGCIELNSVTADESNLSGFLILRKGIEGYYFLDLKTNTILDIGPNHERIYGYIINPNGKFIFAEACRGDNCYYILRTIDQVITTLPSRNDWVLWRWLDNERIIILTLLEPHDVVVLNPFTGDEATIHLELPDPYTIVRTGTESLIPTSIDLSLKRALFYDEQNGGRLVLWNLDTQEEIASIPYRVDRSVGHDLIFGWSPNGEKIIVGTPDQRNTVPNEIFVLNMDGNVAQLSSYNQKYEFANVTGLVWNPDNRRIGFWLKIGTSANSNPDDLPQHLAILDTDSLETQIYCLTFSPALYPAFSIIWSPDGRHLIANTRLASGIVEPTLVDLTRGTQSVISGTQGMWVEGWMVP